MVFSISEVRRHGGHQRTILAPRTWFRCRRSVIYHCLTRPGAPTPFFSIYNQLPLSPSPVPYPNEQPLLMWTSKLGYICP